MASKSVKTQNTLINPMFDIPDGVDDLVYDNSEIVFSDMSDDELDEPYFEDDNDYSLNPGVPDIIGVVSQTVRTTKSGSQVIDVIVEIEDLDEWTDTKYEIRAVKL